VFRDGHRVGPVTIQITAEDTELHPHSWVL
jgi:hypothetical protein